MTVEEDFQNWLIANGCSFPKILWPSNDTASGVRGTIALESIETNEIMLTIPKKLMMCEPGALIDEALGFYFRKNSDILHGDALLCVYIMSECIKGSASFYAPYLRILSHVDSLTEWTLPQLQELQVPLVSAM